MLCCWVTAIVAIAAYWDPKALRGPFVYDDVASVINNDVVMAKVPWHEALTRDFWGKEMAHPASHKSYRPITSLTLRLNMVLSLMDGTAGGPDHTYYFHLVNVVLHGINTGLVTEAAAMVLNCGLDDEQESTSGVTIAGPLMAGILFGIHPVHAEAVSNITSRGELLMTFFYLLAFLSYAKHIQPKPTTLSPIESRNTKEGTNDTSNTLERESKTGSNTPIFQSTKRFACIYILPCLFTAMSIFSKEQGATTLCTLVAYDFIKNHASVKDFFLTLVQERDSYAWDFLKRTIVLAGQTVLWIGLRYWLNGEQSPDFVEEQNPAGFAKDRFTRVFSVHWTYILYLRDMVFPLYLAPDWSGYGIPLMESFQDDRRAYGVLLLWGFSLACLYSLYGGCPPTASKQRKEIRQVVLISLIAFLFLPFLLSSNLLVTTGLAKADRVIYLPLLGYCLLQGLVVKVVSENAEGEGSIWLMVVYMLMASQFALFGLKVHERNMAWADEYTLWVRAYEINPRSYHTKSNAGRVLAKAGEYIQAEEVLRPIKDVRNNRGELNSGDPNDAFLYAVTLGKLDRCPEALLLLDDAMAYVLEERAEAGIRYEEKMSTHTESSLMVARAFCTDNIMEKGRLMYEAATLAPHNDFAQGQFKNYLETLERMQEAMRQQGTSEDEIKRNMMMLSQGVLGNAGRDANQQSGPRQQQRQQPKQQQQRHQATPQERPAVPYLPLVPPQASPRNEVPQILGLPPVEEFENNPEYERMFFGPHSTLDAPPVSEAPERQDPSPAFPPIEEWEGNSQLENMFFN